MNQGNDLRGDYSHINDDYTINQDWNTYTEAEHDLWRKLYDRQLSILPGYAAEDYIRNLMKLDTANEIPHFGRVSEKLHAATGWHLVAVPGLVPDDVFFDHLANRRFPVTVWLRKPEEMDYLVEPDIFHDFFGHVPMLFDPIFADYLAAYGAKGPEAIAMRALKQLSRMYWYMVEFGLIMTQHGLRAYGAGMLSSQTETIYSVTDPSPNRVAFDLERVMGTDYAIDDFQKTYFVLESYDQLFDAMNVPLAPIYDRLTNRPAIDPSTTLATDRLYHVHGASDSIISLTQEPHRHQRPA